MVSIGELREWTVETGALDAFACTDLLNVKAVLREGEVCEQSRESLVVHIPFDRVVAMCKFTELRTIGRQHNVKSTYKTLSEVAGAFARHTCGVDCPPVRAVVGRYLPPMSGEQRGLEFRYMRARMDSDPVGRVEFVTGAPLVLTTFVDANTHTAETTEESVPVVAPARYVFSEPRLTLDGVRSDRTGRGAVRFPPRPITLSRKMEIVRRWVEACSVYALAEGPCAVCARLVREVTRSSVPLDDDWFQLLLEHGTDASRDVRDGNVLDRILCKNGLRPAENVAELCVHCHRAYKKGELPRLSMANGLWIGSVPDELKALNFMEKMLVARYRHNVCVVTVRGGARQMRANAIVLAQPVAKFSRALPPNPSELAEMVAVLCTGPTVLTNEDLRRAPVFVRKAVVLRALEWLRDNHSDYRDLHISTENLDMYDEDSPAVEWLHVPSDGKNPKDAQPVYAKAEDEDDDGRGPCPFVVEGICAEDVVDMSYDDRVELALNHLRKGGRVLRYGQSSSPESIYHNPRMYPGMFPWLFPYGLGGFENENMVRPVPRKTHVKWMLSHFDCRFQVDEYFCFLVFNQEQIRTSSRGTFALVERRNFEDVVEKILSVKEDALAELLRRSRDTGYTVPETPDEMRCFELLSLIDHVGGHVPGSNTRKKWQRSEIRSMIYRYGLPIFFITFAPSESTSPICLYLCGEKVDLDSYVPLMTHDKVRLETVVRNPVACARFFDLMVRLFVEHVLQADSGADGLFGKTAAYYGTVEEQGRKTLHLHALLWIAGCLSPDEIRSRVQSAESTFVSELLEWLDSCVQGECTTGSVDDVTYRLVQQGKPLPGTAAQAPPWADPRVCLPRLPTWSDDADEQARRRWFEQICAVTDEIVALVNQHDKRHPHNCQRPPDFECRARFPRPLEPVSRVDFESGAIFLKKGEAWVNTFNTVLTYLLRCNTDVTCLLSGTSVRAVVAYVTDYITKRSLKTHTMFDVILAVYNARESLTSSCGSRADAARRLITKIVNGFTSRIQLGGPAVCAELLGIPDHYTNKRFKVVYWQSYLRHVDRVVGSDADAPILRGGELDARDLVVLGRHGGRILGYNRMDDYVFRPKEFEDSTLYDYLRSTDVVKWTGLDTKMRSGEDEPCESRSEDADGALGADDDSSDTSSSAEVPVARGRVKYRLRRGHAKRNSHAVVRVGNQDGYVLNFAGGMLPRRDVGDRETYCKAMLTLFTPGGWRTGSEFKLPGETWEDAFARTEFDPEHVTVMKNMNLLYECHDARDDFAAQRRASARLQHLHPVLDGTLDELDVGQPDRRLGEPMDDFGESTYDADAGLQEGSLTAGHRAQMDAMKDFMAREHIPDGRVDNEGLPATHIDSNGGDIDAAVRRDGRHWKRLLAEERKSVLVQARLLPEDVAVSDKGRPAAPQDAEDQVGALDEIAFKYHMRAGEVQLRAYDPELIGLEYNRIKALYSLNQEQYRAFQIIADHLVRKDSRPLRMLLTGMGGTGKTRVFDAVSYFLERRGESHRFLVMAPTGTAASLLGGSTYHSVLGFGRGHGGASKASLCRVRDRLSRVDLLLIDEISMVSCADLHQISERISLAFDVPADAFAGRHFVAAGDFTQLPPAGSGSRPLYSGTVGQTDCRQTIDAQKNSLGKALWHQFVTVVILRENMRQRRMTERDIGYREALENMRYGACSKADIRLLDGRRLDRLQNKGKLRRDKYRFVPVIVPLNTHRDAINAYYSERFAEENNVRLYDFYVVDQLTSGQTEESVTAAVRGTASRARVLNGMTESFRKTLWNLPHAATENVPGKLSICVGMPVMLKYNEATELGVTNGAEGTVHGWHSRPLSGGRFALTTLFVKLKNPPKTVRVGGLPENVVPIVATAERVTCKLPNDTFISVLREQVSAIPNFAITDFNSQGRTRPVNVVDLRECRGPQSVYTCLSRSSSIEDTLILCSWDHGKVTNGIRPDLLRELRELEILNHITILKAENVLPDGIVGETRAELIKTYQGAFGARYVPAGVHHALHWGNGRDVDLRPPVYRGLWHPLNKAKRGSDVSCVHAAKKARPLPPKFSIERLESARLSKASVPSIARRPWAPAFRTEFGLSATGSAFIIPLKWDSTNWSCGYDCMVRVLEMLYTDYRSLWDRLSAECRLARDMETALSTVRDEPSFAHARSVLRRALSEKDPVAFPGTGHSLTAIDELIDAIFSVDRPYGQRFRYCVSCGNVRNVSDLYSCLLSTGYNPEMRTRRNEVRTSALVGSILAEHGRLNCAYCGDQPTVRVGTTFTRHLEILALEVPAEDVRFPDILVDRSFTVTLAMQTRELTLLSVVYLGANHFTCRLIGRDDRVWYYDGMQNGGECVEEDPSVCLSDANGYRACLMLYGTRSDILRPV